jgi:hypothetical protein
VVASLSILLVEAWAAFVAGVAATPAPIPKNDSTLRTAVTRRARRAGCARRRRRGVVGRGGFELTAPVCGALWRGGG